jgi:hypothetical protein
MKKYVQALGYDVWKLVVDKYKEPATPPIDNNGKKLSQNNSSDNNVIFNGLVDSIYVKVMHYDFAKEIWDKLQNVYKGDVEVKATKLQTYRGQFEQL